MSLGDDDGGEDQFVSIPLGGPIFVPDMVSPITRVPDFEFSVFQELQSLKDELTVGALELYEDEISVDELKIMKEEDLVNKAFAEAFMDDELSLCVSHIKEEDVRKTDDKEEAKPAPTCLQNPESDMIALVNHESTDSVPCGDHDNKKSNGKHPQKARKRKRDRGKKNSLDESYLVKVEELAKIKQRQEEDKALVRLHSFNGSAKIPECGTVLKKVEKIRSLKSASVSTKVKSSNMLENIPVIVPDVILCLEVYHNKRTTLKTQEFLVLGRQFLTEVRDRIYCLSDVIMEKAGHYNTSGYFFIEDLFCNDLREPSAVDYSKPIFDWLQNSKDDALEKWESIVTGELQSKQKALLSAGSKQRLPLPRFKAQPMETTRFCDIKFQLGAGYLYCHQGDCKHVIVIRDMRLIHPEDVQNRAAYPLLCFQTKLRYRKCSVCKIYKARKVTVDDKWASTNPCYFCDVCYYMLHYENGSLLYTDFSVYDYHHE